MKNHEYILEFKVKFEKPSDPKRGLERTHSYKIRGKRSRWTVPLTIINIYAFSYTHDADIQQSYIALHFTVVYWIPVIFVL
jgi:hypothetical protein